MQPSTRTVNVVIIGLGTVGGGVYRLITTHAERYRKNLGIDPEQFTSDWQVVVSDPSIDIVVEVIGGEHPATEIFEQSFAAGKQVVTANKALLGRQLVKLSAAARAAGVHLG